jgi:hypothetical protein
VMNGPREIVTLPSTTPTAPLPWPDSTFTSPAWAVLFAATQTLAMAGLATTRATAVPTAPLTPLEIGSEKFFSRVERRGTLLFESWVAAWFTRAFTSSWLVMTAVILVLSAAWIAGFPISGVTFAT